MMDELSVIKEETAIEAFTGETLDDVLMKIREEATSIVLDVTTTQGRKDIASLAMKVSKSKTFLESVGKDIVSDWKEKAKVVDGKRSKSKIYLDELRDEIRKPLTDWEDESKKRKALFESKIEVMKSVSSAALELWMQHSVEIMTAGLDEIQETVIDEKWGEFEESGKAVKQKAIELITRAIELRKKYDAEQEELERLRAKSVEREQKDREEKLRLEGEERAKLEAERMAEKEKERVKLEAEKVEKEKQDAIDAKNEAEERAKKAEANAAIQAEKAAQAERDRIESERLAEEVAAKKREANKAHKTKINNAVLDALVFSGMNKTQAKKAVTAIAKGKIPYTTISY